MTYPQFNFGDRIRKVRRDVAGMSQNEMAAAIGVSQKVFAAWESGRSRPSDIVGVAKRVELLTSVPAGWLLGVNGPDGTGKPVDQLSDMPHAA